MEQTTKVCIKDIMNVPIGIERNVSLAHILNKLLTFRISRLIIFKDKKPIGIVSEKDILNYFCQEKLHTRISEVPINEIIHNIFFNDPSTTLPKAAKFMIDHRCSSTAVGSAGNLVGIVTKTDMTKYYAENQHGKNQVSDHMSSNYFSTFTKDALYGVIGKMLDSEISRTAIVYKERKPVGIITTGDIFRTVLDVESKETTEKILNISRDYEKFWSRFKEFCSQPAEKVMSRGLIKVRENEDLADVCKMIIDKGINALAVEDSNGQITGIIGKREILLTLANMD